MIVVEYFDFDKDDYVTEEAEGDTIEKEATYREKSVLEFIAYLKKNEHQIFSLVSRQGWIRWREQE